MRADAEAKRAAILKAARTLFASHGSDVPFSTVAATAGVGIATLYRHFPTPPDLRRGVFLQACADVQALETPHLEAMSRDPQRGWHEYLQALAGLQIGSWLPNIVAHVLTEDVDEIRLETLGSINRVLDAAKSAHLVQANISPIYLQISIALISRPLNPIAEEFAPGHAAWLLDVFERGIRPA